MSAADRPEFIPSNLSSEITAVARRGWRLFPLCRPDDLSFEMRDRGKAPARGFVEWQHRATSDLAQLEAWAAAYPACNWGVATGAGSGVVVVDIDGEAGRASRAALERKGYILPPTLTVTTGREDGGEHLYYQHPTNTEIKNNNSGKLGPHIDVRGTGGYVVADGSTHVTGRQYRCDSKVPLAVLPDWAVERLRRPAARPSAAPGGGTTKVGKGGRHNLLVSLAGSMLRRGMSLAAITAALLAENAETCDPPVPEQKVRELAADVVRRYPPRATDGAGGVASDSVQAAIHDPRPMVRLQGNNWLLSQTAEAMGRHFADKLLFLRNGEIVTLESNELRNISGQTFRTLVERHIVGYREREAGGGTYDVIVTMTANEASGLMASPQFVENLRRLRRVNRCRLPVVRDDGNLELLPAGYDAASQTLTINTVTYADDMPLDLAKETLDDLLSEFCFADEGRSKAVAVAALVGLFSAQLLPEGSLRPCFIVTKNAEGAGASTLVSCAVVPFIGYMPTGVKSDDDDETRKTLTSAVREGRSVILLDNQRSRLSSAALEAFVSSPTWSDRLLGVNQTFTGPNLATVFVTANGATVSPDMRRRSLIIELHLDVERAEDRHFRRPLDLAALLALSPNILAGCWSMLRHWHGQGQPAPNRSHSAFPMWARVVGGIVQAAGYGCALDSANVAVAADEDGDAMRALLDLMTPRRPYTFSEIVVLCQANDCFADLVGEKGTVLEKSGRTTLARILRRYDHRLVKSYRFIIDGKGHKRRYSVEEVVVPKHDDTIKHDVSAHGAKNNAHEDGQKDRADRADHVESPENEPCEPDESGHSRNGKSNAQEDAPEGVWL